MPHTARHGHEPSDQEIAAHGYRAFAPARPPFVPTKEDFHRAHSHCATGDPDELAELGQQLADLFPGWWPGYFWGWPGIDDD